MHLPAQVSVETMSDGSHWEYFAGYTAAGKEKTAVWKDDVSTTLASL